MTPDVAVAISKAQTVGRILAYFCIAFIVLFGATSMWASWYASRRRPRRYLRSVK